MAHISVLSIVQQESEFNPTTRPWFRNAKPDGTIKLSEPYLRFTFLKRTAHRIKANFICNHVVGADFTLDFILSDKPTRLFTTESVGLFWPNTLTC